MSTVNVIIWIWRIYVFLIFKSHWWNLSQIFLYILCMCIHQCTCKVLFLMIAVSLQLLILWFHYFQIININLKINFPSVCALPLPKFLIWKKKSFFMFEKGYILPKFSLLKKKTSSIWTKQLKLENEIANWTFEYE